MSKITHSNGAVGAIFTDRALGKVRTIEVYGNATFKRAASFAGISFGQMVNPDGKILIPALVTDVCNAPPR